MRCSFVQDFSQWVFFFPAVYFFIGSLESFIAHYTDNTCVSNAPVQPLKRKFSGWKWTSCICKFNCSSSFLCFKVHMKEMMKKRYILEYVSPLLGIKISSTYSEITKRKRFIYFVHQKPEKYCLCLFVCVCER